MSRRNRAEKRPVNPDPKYGSVQVSKFSNYLMLDGKRTVANTILYGALEILRDKTKKEELPLFVEIIDKVKPTLEVRSRRVGGATYQVPTEVNATRREALSMRWIITAARKRGEKTMDARLAGEFLDILSGNGAALKKKTDVHKMAEANKAFAHFRW